MSADRDVVTCAVCGREADAAASRLTWSSGVERGEPRAYCDVCSRRHLRAMEGKLHEEHW